MKNFTWNSLWSLIISLNFGNPLSNNPESTWFNNSVWDRSRVWACVGVLLEVWFEISFEIWFEGPVVGFWRLVEVGAVIWFRVEVGAVIWFRVKEGVTFVILFSLNKFAVSSLICFFCFSLSSMIFICLFILIKKRRRRRKQTLGLVSLLWFIFSLN